jgi:hypothetical protein
MINFLLIDIVTSFHVVFIVLSSAGLLLPGDRTFVFSALDKNFEERQVEGNPKGNFTRLHRQKFHSRFLQGYLFLNERPTVYLTTFVHMHDQDCLASHDN